MPAQEQSIQNESRHAVFVNRFAGGLANQFLPFADELKKEIRSTLIDYPQTIDGIRRLNALLRDLNETQTAIYLAYAESLQGQLELFTGHETEFELNSIKSVIETDVDLTLPAPNQAWAAVTSQPLVFPDSNDAVLLKPFIKNWTESEINRVDGIIKSGFYLGETTDQMARKITSKGGTIDSQTVKNNKTVVRTAVNHVSAVARQQTMQENDDVVTGYEWVSTLDSRTTSQCKSLDGKIFKWNDKKKLLPPIHPNCRSTTVPVLDQRYNLDDEDATRASKGDEGGQQISADTTYYSFLKNQSAAFQDETLGPTRGKLFRNGGLTSEEFSRLNVDQLYRPLTLEEMRKKDPMAFEKAGL